MIYTLFVSRVVSVVIPVRNDVGGLPAAVASVLRQAGPFELEVWVCVGPSSDGTEEVATELAEHPNVEVLSNHNGSIPAALNLGLHAASGDILVRVDARTALPPNYIRIAIEVMAAERTANVAAIQRPVGNSRTQRGIALAMAHRLGSGGAAYRSGSKAGPADTGFLGVFDVAKLRNAGGWDERFQRNEDAELNHRLLPRGGVWLDPRLVVDYWPRSSLPLLARQYFDYGWWRRVTMSLHPESRALRQWAAPMIVVCLTLAIAVAPSWPVALACPLAYVVAVVGVGVFSSGHPPAERMTMVLALVVMHFCWGCGFLVSAIRGPRLAPRDLAPG